MAGVDARRSGRVEDVEGPRENIELVWTSERGKSVGTTPLLAGGRLYVGVDPQGDEPSGELAALEAATGKEAWTRELDSRPPTPALVDGGIVVESFDLERYPLNGDGDRVWAVDHEGGSSLGVADGRVFAPDLNPSGIVAFDTDDGATTWTHTVENTSTAVTVGRDRAYVGSYLNDLVAVARDGTEEWRYPLGTDVTVTPTVADGLVLTGGVDFAYHAVRADDGTRAWRVETGGPVYATPAVTDGVAVGAGTDGTVRAIELGTGERRWLYDAGDSLDRSFFASPVTDGRTVYCGDVGGRLFALDVATGDPLWHRDLDARLVTSPTVADGHVFVATPDGRVVAFAGGGARG